MRVDTRDLSGAAGDGTLSAELAGSAARILVIKLSALGDVFHAVPAFEAVRAHHRDDHITLLTTAPFAEWLGRSGFFDAVWVDDRPARWRLGAWRRLRERLTSGDFARVYDLQTSGRSRRYFELFPRDARPEWSGIAPGCSHPDADPNRTRLDTQTRIRGQLGAAGIARYPERADFAWAGRWDARRFDLPPHHLLLVPGASPRLAIKRWPISHWRDLAGMLVQRGVAPVIIGGQAEQPLAAAIREACPQAIDLTARTDLDDLVDLFRSAPGAVGGDTGPMHLSALLGRPSLILFSAHSDPAVFAPRGPLVRVLKRASLGDLAVGEVLTALETMGLPSSRSAP